MQHTIIKEFENHPDVVVGVFQQGGSHGETLEWAQVFWENNYLRSFVLWDPTGTVGQQYGQPQTNLPFGRNFVIDQAGDVSLPIFGHNPRAIIDEIWGLLGDPPGVPYCFGDGSGTPCPCGNDNDGSVPGSGCANGVFASGARLDGTGEASVSADTVVLSASSLEPSNYGLFFQGDNDLSPGIAFGDGLRCAGGGLIRLQARLADAAGVSGTTIAIGQKGGVSAGETKYYQCWYRNVIAPPCGPGLNDFNLTGGYRVTWAP